MTVSELITFVRDQAYANSTEQVTDATILSYLTIIRNEMISKIISRVGEGYFYQYISTNLVSGTSEYVLQQPSASTAGVKKVLSVEVKWSNNDAFYSYLKPKDNRYAETTNDYLATLNVADGFYDILGNSIKLYPTPTNNVTNGLKMQVYMSSPDLVSGGAESTIFPNHQDLRDYHYIIAIGACSMVLMKRQQVNEANNMLNRYTALTEGMLSFVTDRYDGPIDTYLADTSAYK